MGKGHRCAVATVALISPVVVACSVLTSLDGLAGAELQDSSETSPSLRDSRADVADVVDAAADAADAADARGAQDASDASPTSFSLFSDTLPAVDTDPEGSTLEVGVRFKVATAGDIVAIRFYRGVPNAQGYVVHLWAPGDVLLASMIVPPDSGPSGWRERPIAPTRVLPSAEYIASYFSSNGSFAFTPNAFLKTVTSGPLMAPAAGAAGSSPNGVFDYSGQPLTKAPTRGYQDTNYFVDVVFKPL